MILNTKNYIYSFFLVAACCSTSCAQLPVKSGNSYAKFIEASEQTTLPGRRESEPIKQEHFIIVWKSKATPETFYWRGTDGWVNMAVLKVHKNKSKAVPKYEFGETWYTTEDISVDKVKKGDTLELTTVYGGKNTIPSEITEKMKNRIFFKTKNTGWLYIPVSRIIKRPDIAMP